MVSTLQDGTQRMLFSIIVLLIIFTTIQQTVFAERSIQFEKVLDIQKENLQEILLDLNNLPKIFPNNIKSIESVENQNGRALAKTVLTLNGFDFSSNVLYTKKTAEKHIMEIISGDLKGTKLDVTLKETWGFDGTPNAGTIVNIRMNLQFSGLASLLGFISDESLTYVLDKFLIDVVSDVNASSEKNLQQNQNDLDENENDSKKKIVKKGHRRR